MLNPLGPAVLAIALLAGPALAQDPVGNPGPGKGMALDICTPCHLVAQDQEAPVARVGPSFYALSEDPAVTEFRLRVFLMQTPHPVMPNFILTDEEADDLAAYILGLAE